MMFSDPVATGRGACRAGQWRPEIGEGRSPGSLGKAPGCGEGAREARGLAVRARRAEILS